MVSWIAPDEGYLLFSSTRRGERDEHAIYASTRSTAGDWGAAAPISALNTCHEAGAPYCLIPDGFKKEGLS